MILRNFLTTLRRFRLASMLNIVGLSVSFAAFVVILMQVNYEWGFDKGYPKQIYRVQMTDSVAFGGVWLPRPMCDILLEASPAIAAGTIHGGSWGDSYISLERNGSRTAYLEPIDFVYPGEAEVFGYEFTEGDPKVFEDHTKLALSQSMARKLFGTESAVGQIITLEDQTDDEDRKRSFEVGAVYRDFPANSSIGNGIKRKITPGDNDGNWSNWNYNFYVTLVPGSDPAEVARQLSAEFARFGKPNWVGNKFYFTLVPLQDVYYDMTVDQDYAPKGSRSTQNMLLAIALLVIGIAAVNFVNFATSLTPLRIKNINTRKVLGSPVGALRAELIFESTGIALLSFGLGLLWIYGLRTTAFNDLISGGISFSAYSGVIGLSAAVALVVGVVSGLYPAFYTTSFPPALVLKKGSFGMSPTGRKLRTALIGFQFVVSIGLIVAAMFLQLQNNYLRHFDTGMDQEQVAVLTMNNSQAEPEMKQAIVNELMSSPLIEDVAFAYTKIGLTDQYMGWTRSLTDGREMRYSCCPVSWNFLRVMGLQVVDGRDFTEDDQRKDGTQIFNEAAMRQYGLTIDDRVNDQPIAGVVGDFNFASLRNAIAPLCLYEFGAKPWMNLRIAYIKIVGDPYAAVDHIRRTMAKFDPLYPVDIEFFDTTFDSIYQKERKTTALITIFSLLAVVISLVGVFGLVLFETQYRRKEIGVRKVMGATVAEILEMFNRKFVRLVLVCFVVAAPLAWYGVREWLSTFAYRTPIYWWVFAVSLMIVLLITLLTVTVQSWRAATANPVGALRAE
ncbi:MAG: ABC transporter permease [Rikenella sp.]|nr:ABC transporter permease [Rikenella sp.]